MPKVIKYTVGFLFIILFGALRIAPESRLTANLRDQNLLAKPLNLDLRDQLSQMGFVAAFGGFRSLIASLLNIRAYVAWESTEWEVVDSSYATMTKLQPNNVFYWDNWHWHMAYNAASHMSLRPDMHQILRTHYHDTYVKKGRDILLESLKILPDDFILNEKLATIYARKLDDPCKAWGYFAKAAESEEALPYNKRFAAYEYDKCFRDTNPQACYDKLKSIYDIGDGERVPTLVTRIKELEDILNIPQNLRILEEKHPNAP